MNSAILFEVITRCSFNCRDCKYILLW